MPHVAGRKELDTLAEEMNQRLLAVAFKSDEELPPTPELLALVLAHISLRIKEAGLTEGLKRLPSSRVPSLYTVALGRTLDASLRGLLATGMSQEEYELVQKLIHSPKGKVVILGR